MTAPNVQGTPSVTGTAGTAAASVTNIALPTHATGDIIEVKATAYLSSFSSTAPGATIASTGGVWTLIRSDTSGYTGGNLLVSTWWCLATSSSMNQPTVTLTGGNCYANCQARIIRGADNTNPVNAHNAGVSSTLTSTVTATGVTTTAADCLLVVETGSGPGNRTHTTTSGWTEDVDNTNSGFGPNEWGEWLTQAVAGATGNITTTASGTVSYVATMIAYQPPVALAPKGVIVRRAVPRAAYR